MATMVHRKLVHHGVQHSIHSIPDRPCISRRLPTRTVSSLCDELGKAPLTGVIPIGKISGGSTQTNSSFLNTALQTSSVKKTDLSTLLLCFWATMIQVFSRDGCGMAFGLIASQPPNLIGKYFLSAVESEETHCMPP